MRFEVRDADKGLKDLIKRVFEMKQAQIHVGILEADAAKPHEGGGGTVLAVATVHEFGLGHVPQRSFLGSYFDENAGRHRSQIRAMLQSVIKGKRTPAQMLDLLGLQWVGEIQKRISAGISPALAAATIRRKTRADGAVADIPLILTGQLRASISHLAKLAGRTVTTKKAAAQAIVATGRSLSNLKRNVRRRALTAARRAARKGS